MITPFEVLKTYRREMRERLRRPKTPFDILRLTNLRNRGTRRGLVNTYR